MAPMRHDRGGYGGAGEGVPIILKSISFCCFVLHVARSSLIIHPIGAPSVVEVAHEALIRSWPQLRKWIDADRAGLRTRTRLTGAACDWKNATRDPAYLYTGARLAVAKEWTASHLGELSADEAEFLDRSLEAQKQREVSELEAARRRALAALILLSISVLLWRKSVSAEAEATRQAQIANAQRLSAQTAGAAAEKQARIAKSQRLAVESSTTQNPQRKLLLAVEATKRESRFRVAGWRRLKSR
jgi:hypothetical protein